MKNSTTFDGLESLAAIDSRLRSADIFSKIRILTENGLFVIAGPFLIQPKMVA